MKASSAHQRDDGPAQAASGRWGRLLAAILSTLGMAIVVAACGGGTTQQTAFAPSRVIAFGDDMSVLTATGRKYSINALATDLVSVDCGTQTLWVQAVANSYSFAYPECNPAGNATTPARSRAVAGARVDNLAAQVDAQLADGGLDNKDLVTVLMGVNDVWQLYGQYTGSNESALIDEARARGERLAAQVNRIVGTGARVLVLTIPDLSFSPFALAQKAQFTDTDRAALIGRLVAALNGRLRTNIINDGRLIGLVLADETTQLMSRFPGAYALLNGNTAACTVALPDCTTATLVTDATGLTHVWASDRLPGPSWHAQVGIQAVSRALNNPF
jgi:outer membrane lipase/esterase